MGAAYTGPWPRGEVCWPCSLLACVGAALQLGEGEPRSDVFAQSGKNPMPGTSCVGPRWEDWVSIPGSGAGQWYFHTGKNKSRCWHCRTAKLFPPAASTLLPLCLPLASLTPCDYPVLPSSFC